MPLHESTHLLHVFQIQSQAEELEQQQWRVANEIQPQLAAREAEVETLRQQLAQMQQDQHQAVQAAQAAPMQGAGGLDLNEAPPDIMQQMQQPDVASHDQPASQPDIMPAFFNQEGAVAAQPALDNDTQPASAFFNYPQQQNQVGSRVPFFGVFQVFHNFLVIPMC